MRILAPIVGFFSILSILFWWCSATVIDSTEVGVINHFGSLDVNQKPLAPGLHFTAPIATSVDRVDTIQKTIEVDSKTVGTSVDKNGVQMTVDATIAFSINPNAAPFVIKSFGNDYETTLLARAAPSAVRDSVLDFSWSEAMTTKHDALANEIREKFKGIIVDNLVSKGMSKSQAETAFDIPEVKLQELLPPQRILDANSEYQAATVDRERQTILTEIAGKEAERREKEGDGISKMMNALPKNFTTQQIVDVMKAVSMKTEADAMTRAVEENKINLMVLPYGQAVSPPAK